MSTIMPRPWPLWLPRSRVPPSGVTRRCFSATKGSVVGVPASSSAQPDGIGVFHREATESLPMATVVVAMSSTNGAWRPAGAANEIGLVVRARLLDARLHRPGGDVVAEALLPVEETGGHLVTHDRRLGVHTDIAGLPQLVVAREHADPVRVDTAQVGAHHEPGRHFGDRARHLHGDERGDDELMESGVADEDR